MSISILLIFLYIFITQPKILQADQSSSIDNFSNQNQKSNFLINNPNIYRFGHHILLSTALQNSNISIYSPSIKKVNLKAEEQYRFNILNHAFFYSFHMNLFKLKNLFYFVGSKFEISYPVLHKYKQIKLPYSNTIPSFSLGVKFIPFFNNSIWLLVDYTLRSLKKLQINQINSKFELTNGKKNNDNSKLKIDQKDWYNIGIYCDDFEIGLNWVYFFDNLNGVSMGFSYELVRFKPYPFIEAASSTNLGDFYLLKKSTKFFLAYVYYIQ